MTKSRTPGNTKTENNIRSPNEPSQQMKIKTDGANVKAVVSVPQAVLFSLKFLKVKGK